MLVSIKRQLNYLPAFRVAKTPCQIHIPKLATKIGQKVVDCFLPQKNCNSKSRFCKLILHVMGNVFLLLIVATVT